MVVFKGTQVRNLWAVDPEYPRHSISLFMGQKRWEQLKRFFHVSLPPPEGAKRQVFKKIEPLMTGQSPGTTICQMLLVRFAQIDHVNIDRAYLRCSSLDQGQGTSSTSSFTHTFIRQMLYQSIAFILILLSSISITQFRQYNTNPIFIQHHLSRSQTFLPSR